MSRGKGQEVSRGGGAGSVKGEETESVKWRRGRKCQEGRGAGSVKREEGQEVSRRALSFLPIPHNLQP